MRRPASRRLVGGPTAALLLLAALALPSRSATAIAQTTDCADLCAVACLKPIALPDRWDDITPIPGYAGGGTRTPNWVGNNHWDHEDYTDSNGNGLHDDGEPFVDANGNGIYDEERYDPELTGYVAQPTPGNSLAPAGDVGRELVIKISTLGSPYPGLYIPVDFPPINKGGPLTGGDQFVANWSACESMPVEAGDRLQPEPGNMVGYANEYESESIARDPGAFWDEITQTVRGSQFAQSPRIWFIAAYDPRIPITVGRHYVVVTRVLVFFAESMAGNAAVRGRLLRAEAAGQTCPASTLGGFAYSCAVPAQQSTWGRVKATYR